VGCLKRYNCFHKSRGFPGEVGYSAACAENLRLLQLQEHPFALKKLLFPGEGTPPLISATTSQLKHYRLSKEGEMEMALLFMHMCMVNWTKNELSGRNIQKPVEERKITNQIFFSTKPQT